MRFRLETLSTPRFELDLTRPGSGTRGLVLENVAGLGGLLEVVPEHVRLASASLQACVVTGGEWSLAQGRVTVGTSATLTAVAVDGEVPRGCTDRAMSGRASVGRLDAGSVTVDAGMAHVTLAMDARALSVENEATPGSGLTMTAGAVSLASVQAAFGRGAARVDRVALAQGFMFADGAFHAREVTIDELGIELADLGAARTGPQSAPEQAQPDGDARLGYEQFFDLRLLDRISGRVSADVTVDARVPIIGRRRATHEVRVAVDKGFFDIRELERGLATLEDFILDFEIRDGALILERDVPLIGLRKDLVRWQLEPEDLPLARKGRIRLRALPGYSVLAPSQGKKIELLAVSVDGIDIALGMARPEDSSSELGGVVRDLAIAACRIQGALRHPETQRRTVRLEAEGVAACVEALPIGHTMLARGRISIDVLTVDVVFAGLAPISATIAMRGVRIGDLAVEPRAGKPAP